MPWLSSAKETTRPTANCVAERGHVRGIGGIDDQRLPERGEVGGEDGGARAQGGELGDRIEVEVGAAVGGDGRVAVKVEGVDVAVDVIGVHVLALELGDGAAVDVSAEIGAAGIAGVIGVAGAVVAFADGIEALGDDGGARAGGGGEPDEEGAPEELATAEPAVGGDRAFAGGIAEVVGDLGAVVGVGLQEIDFFAGVFADIAHPDIAGLRSRLMRKVLRVPVK